MARCAPFLIPREGLSIALLFLSLFTREDFCRRKNCGIGSLEKSGETSLSRDIT